MERHVNELISYAPNLLKGRVLDLGSGRGDFVIEVAKRGGDVVGVEPYPKYVEISKQKLSQSGLRAHVLQGEGENIPFPGNHFDFVNMTEVIEHVEDPDKVLGEVYRVLKPGGNVYMSVPNRFGMKDQHFNLYFVNWFPRFLSDLYISIFGKHKNYTNTAGRQRLSEMHYKTFLGARKVCKETGFGVLDIRIEKINKRYGGLKKAIAKLVYHIIRPWYFDSFHLLLTK